MKPLVYADFNKLDDVNSLVLTCVGSQEDLSGLCAGTEVTFYTDDADDLGNPNNLLVEGVLEYDESGDYWVGRVNWDTLRHERVPSILPSRASFVFNITTFLRQL